MKILYANNYAYIRGGSERVLFDEIDLLAYHGTKSAKEMGDFLKVVLWIPPPVAPPVERVLLVCKSDISREEMQNQLGIRNKKHFLGMYLRPALDSGFLGMTIPEKPNSPLQRYRLTELGKQWIEGQEKV